METTIFDEVHRIFTSDMNMSLFSLLQLQSQDAHFFCPRSKLCNASFQNIPLTFMLLLSDMLRLSNKSYMHGRVYQSHKSQLYKTG